ncbi:MAG: hypothetical protein L0Z46_02735 [Nitrospiraceae bacterium]|nr:hypothetical protein [Nitrospiraceae bacterium]
MTTNTILDDAEQRIGSATAAAKDSRRQIIEVMRDEIGEPHLKRAEIELPKMETVITKEVRPYLDRLTRLSHHATTPLRPDILAHVRELENACATGTDWVRTGIEEYKRLTPPFESGTQKIDMSRRAAEVYGIRIKLMNWDGKVSRWRDLMAYIDQYIQDSGWPASAPVERS